MTNPDREELVKLADELIAQNYGNVRDTDTMEEHFTLLAKAASALRRLASSDGGVKGEPATSRVSVPEGQTPLNDKLGHRYLDVIREGATSRDTGAGSPYHGHSLEHCLHAAGWVSRDLRIALDKARAAPPADAGMRDEVGWLIEMNDPPVYCVLNPNDLDEQWTPDVSRAIRFARREDAQACADHTGWTSPPVRIVEHMWPALTAPGATTKSDVGDLALAAECAGKLCEDCPPVGYPTDKTRCSPCPRRTTKSDVEALAATTAERPGTVTSEPEPSTSESARDDVPLGYERVTDGTTLPCDKFRYSLDNNGVTGKVIGHFRPIKPGPSDPSSTRSEVTVDELAAFIRWSEPDGGAIARALLDQFEIRRK